MTRKKGGGRESGGVSREDNRGDTSSPRPKSPAAANPAAPEFQTPEWVRWASERIRELEAELAEVEAFTEEYLGTVTKLYDRAERAEALVQRARELIPDWPPEELRGEDRG